jgi:hypothetical protein
MKMFKKYGVLGIVLILLVELNFIFKIEPFASWYFPIIWLGYILTIDAVVYKLRRHSLISNKPWQILGMFLISALFWWIFEFANLGLNNWGYSGMEFFSQSITMLNLFSTLSFATVLPALFETYELIRTVHIFENVKLKKRHNIKKKTIYIMWAAGLFCFVSSVFFPVFAFPLIWASFFLILDPINYIHKQPSIIKHWEDRKFAIPLSLMLAGIIMGFFWEFWNFWAVPKWTYNIPYLGFLKVFEMPILGYICYMPFALELYAMYFFVRSLFIHKEHLLVE